MARRIYLTKQTPHVRWKWMEYAELFDLSGFAPVAEPESIPRKRKASNTIELKNPYWHSMR